MSAKPVTLYGFTYGDRSGRMRWLFEELGIDYQDHFLNWDLREHQSAEYLKINPMGRVPTVLSQGRALWEPGAICLEFVDRHPDLGLAPAVDSAHRLEFQQWIFFATATLEPILERIWRNKEIKNQSGLDASKEELKAAAILLESGLSGRDYLVGNEFSAADIMIGGLMAWGDDLIKLSPLFKLYFERLKKRPACKRSRIFD